LKGESKNGFTIYSNAASGKLFVNSTEKEISNIQLFDMSGRVVYSENVSGQNGTVDTTGIAGGLYIVKIHTGDIIFADKVIIN